MRLVRKEKNGTVLAFTADELAVIGNALNESLERLEDWEFATRMGAGKAEVEKLLGDLVRIQAEG